MQVSQWVPKWINCRVWRNHQHWLNCRKILRLWFEEECVSVWFKTNVASVAHLKRSKSDVYLTTRATALVELGDKLDTTLVSVCWNCSWEKVKANWLSPEATKPARRHLWSKLINLLDLICLICVKQGNTTRGSSCTLNSQIWVLSAYSLREYR